MLKRTARRGPLGRFWAVATNPWVALPAWAAATWVWAIPAVFDYTSQHALLHYFSHLTLFYTGFALWWLIISPLPSERREAGYRAPRLLGLLEGGDGVRVLAADVAEPHPLPAYVSAPRAYGISALTDQRLAGASMCLIELLVFGIALSVVFVDLLARDERAQALADLASASH